MYFPVAIGLVNVVCSLHKVIEEIVDCTHLRLPV